MEFVLDETLPESLSSWCFICRIIKNDLKQQVKYFDKTGLTLNEKILKRNPDHKAVWI